MKIQTMAQELIDHGYSQGSLAKAVATSGVPCSQPTIWRILKGTDPSYTLGNAIREIHKAEVVESVA